MAKDLGSRNPGAGRLGANAYPLRKILDRGLADQPFQLDCQELLQRPTLSCRSGGKFPVNGRGDISDRDALTVHRSKVAAKAA
jgi:hypothetical protein